ncbi:MAG TPA: M15 family metallopeptidase [Steroidobacteraceae bacterium]|nr:M15 family metallopeptidase [Steroidobacteraceae bacterium]
MGGRIRAILLLLFWFGVAAALPPDAPSDLKRLIGEYRSGEAALTVYEVNGALFADGFTMHQTPLRRISATRFLADAAQAQAPTVVNFEIDPSQRAAAAIVGGTRVQFRDIGTEVVEKIRAGVKSDNGRLRAAALAAKPPEEAAPRRAFDLVDVATVDPGIKFDIRYASSNNFIGFPLYERPAAFLQRPAAEALGRVERALAPKGYGLLIHDAYRPWFVTKMFWDATPKSAHVFVADPAQGSRHNRGCAVDLTLYDLKTGRTVEMTGRYDEMSPRSFADYVGGTSHQRWLRELLRSEMEAQGFAVYPQEWWHFDYKDWNDYGIGNATFTELK